MTLVEKPILNPSLPYIGPIQTGISPGKYIRILGAALPYGKVIKCNLQCGSSGYDDIALQLQINFGQNLITLNSHQYNSRDEEQSYGNLYITKGEQFEILIICEPTVFKIGINGNHLCEFPHKIPFVRISHLKLEGDASISHISIENQSVALESQNQRMNQPQAPPPPYSAAGDAPYSASGPPYPTGGVPYLPPDPSHVTAGSQYPSGGSSYPPGRAPGGPPPIGLFPPPSGNTQPPPLNSYHQPAPGYTHNVPQPGAGYASDPLLQQQAQIAALNATPRQYYGRFGGYRNNKNSIFVVCGVFGFFSILFVCVMIAVFLSR